MADFQKPPRGSTPAPDHIMLSVPGDAETTMAVTWRTDIGSAEGWLIYHTAGGEETRVEAVHTPFVSDIDRSMIHTAIARGLTPGTKYHYTVGDALHRSEVFAFETAPENLTHYRFLIIADQQNGVPFSTPEYRPVRDMLRYALNEFPDARFILTLGDNVSNGQHELQWNGMFHGLRGIIEQIPFMMLTGNHDNRGYAVYTEEKKSGKFYMDRAEFFNTQFGYAYPRNGFPGYLCENYAFDYGDVHFTMMGINAFEQIADWAADDLQRSQKRWKLAAFHFPFFPVMPEGVGALCLPSLYEKIDGARPDIVFAGHEHSFARSFPIRDYQIYDRPSEGAVHYILGNSGENIFSSNADKIWYTTFYPQEEPNSMFAVVDVTPDTLTVRAFLHDGRPVDTLVIDKQRDTIFPPAPAPVYRRTRMAFKGALVELAARDINVHRRGDTVFVPFGVLAQSIGAPVEKLPGCMTVSLYGKRVTFTENTQEAYAEPVAPHNPSTETNVQHAESGQYNQGIAADQPAAVPLAHAVYRGDKGQLYVSADDLAMLFGLSWRYAAHNNFVDFDYPTEEYPCSIQP